MAADLKGLPPTTIILAEIDPCMMTAPTSATS
jgi:hypothetical protein